MDEAADEGAELICFPENSLYFRVRDDDRFAGFSIADPIFDPICEAAQDKGVTIHLGGIPLNEYDLIYNASLAVHPDGTTEILYKKTHLFDIALKGGEAANESDYFTAGTEWANWQWDEWNIGQSICFDVRFPELFRHAVDQGAEAFTVPAAFIMTTGKAHWELLIRTRAVETQSFIFAAAQGGVHRGTQGGEKRSWGHSMIVNPWGKVLCQAEFEPQVLVTDVDRREVAELRKQVPLALHRQKCQDNLRR